MRVKSLVVVERTRNSFSEEKFELLLLESVISERDALLLGLHDFHPNFLSRSWRSVSIFYLRISLSLTHSFEPAMAATRSCLLATL